MVAGSERAELLEARARLLRVEVGPLVGGEPGEPRVAAMIVALANAGRNPRLSETHQTVHRIRKIRGREASFHRDHAAAVVHTDRGRDDRAGGRDDRTDARALAEMGIGHQRDVTRDEGEAARALGLGQRLRLDLV